MKNIAIILTRNGLKDKNIKIINNKPLLTYRVKDVKDSFEFNGIITFIMKRMRGIAIDDELNYLISEFLVLKSIAVSVTETGRAA